MELQFLDKSIEIIKANSAENDEIEVLQNEKV